MLQDYLMLVSAYMRGQMAYRSSYLIELFGMASLTIGNLIAVFFLFKKFGAIGEWQFWEIVYIYGVANTAMGGAQIFSSGLSHLPQFIKTGEFDRFLLRPVNPLIHLLPYSFALYRIGRMLQGLLACGLAISMTQVELNLINCWLILSTIAAMTILFFSLFLCGATTTFWTVESSEVFNAFTYGGLELSKFPVSIYQPWIKFIFLFVIPIGFVSYFPTVALFQKIDVLHFPIVFQYTSIIIAVLYLFFSLKFWQFGIKHYQSTGS